MKIYITLMVLSTLFFTSCKEWLEIQPEGESVEEQIFSTGNGYRSVLNGLYKSMSEAALYGGDLGFGFVDCMSQQYKLDLMTYQEIKYVSAKAFRYTDRDLASAIEATWIAAFNIVANANCLIQNASAVSPDLFTGGETERKMILGEAYACRALMHFDMLRLFAPAPENDDQKAYVPYVDIYPDVLAKAIPVTAFLDKVIADLERASGLTMEFDTSALGQSVSATGRARFYNEVIPDMDSGYDSFFKGRGYRLSYYAITALLARVYQYAERYSDAFNAAKKVMEFQTENDKGIEYPFFSKDDFSKVLATTDFEKKEDLKVVSNLIFAVYNENAYTYQEIMNGFRKELTENVGGNSWLIVNTEAQKTFYTSSSLIDEAKQDYRYAEMVFLANGQYPVSGKWFSSKDTKIRDGNITIMPVIRSTEMRYIMAECYAREGNFAEAQNILTQVRENRGCVEAISVTDWKSFVRELVCDARREWISEGQLFYLYKRLNADVIFDKNVIRPLKRNEYLLPIPSSQIL